MEIQAQPQKKQGYLSKSIISLLSGNLSGWASVTVGQPLDYFKVHYQIHSKLPSFLQVYHNIGFKGFYSGASSIYLMVGTVSALQFTIFQNSSLYLKQRGWKDSAQNRNISNLMLSGFITGSVSSLIYTPIEYAKIQCQTSLKTKTQGSIRLMYNLIRQNRVEGIKKLYTGLGITMIRQSIGSSLYFGSFHIILTNLWKYDRDKAPIYAQLGAGSLAGIIYQMVTYPLDTIKTNMQSTLKRDAGELVRNRFWRERSFRLGFMISVLRSVIIDGTNFAVFENCRQFLVSSV